MLILTVEWLALLAGLVSWRTASPRFVRIIIAAVAFTVLAENFEEWSAPAFKSSNRMLLYNIHSVVEMSAWFCFYHFVFRDTKIRMVVWLMIVTTFAFTVIEIFGYRNIKQFHVDSYRFFSICMICLAIRYLFAVLHMNRVYHPEREPVFWMTAACIVFHLVFYEQLTVFEIPQFANDPKSVSIFRILLTVSNIIYYLLLCMGFLSGFFRVKQSTDQFRQA